MIDWYWLIVVFLLTNAITAFTYEFFEWENLWVEVIGWLALIVLYLPLSFYHIFFKNTLHPISQTRFNELQEKWIETKEINKSIKIGKNLYLWIDLDAKRLYNKAFFVRVKNTKAP
jgi:hypothetical protein